MSKHFVNIYNIVIICILSASRINSYEVLYSLCAILIVYCKYCVFKVRLITTQSKENTYWNCRPTIIYIKLCWRHLPAFDTQQSHIIVHSIQKSKDMIGSYNQGFTFKKLCKSGRQGVQSMTDCGSQKFLWEPL
jgi:hypothetical protein